MPHFANVGPHTASSPCLPRILCAPCPHPMMCRSAGRARPLTREIWASARPDPGAGDSPHPPKFKFNGEGRSPLAQRGQKPASQMHYRAQPHWCAAPQNTSHSGVQSMHTHDAKPRMSASCATHSTSAALQTHKNPHLPMEQTIACLHAPTKRRKSNVNT